MKTILKSLAIAAVAATIGLTNAPQAQAQEAYTGNWYYRGNTFSFSNNTDGWYLRLYPSERWCGRPASHGYDTIKRLLNRSNSNIVDWRIVERCSDGYVRVHITTMIGQSFYNTWREGNWHDTP